MILCTGIYGDLVFLCTGMNWNLKKIAGLLVPAISVGRERKKIFPDNKKQEGPAENDL